MGKRRLLPPTFKEQEYPLNEDGTKFLVVKGCMMWIREIFPHEVRISIRYIYDSENLLPDMDVAVLSPHMARIRYRSGKQLTVLIQDDTITYKKYEVKNDEEE